MLKISAVVTGLMWLSLGVSSYAAEAPKLMAAGEWSEPVADTDGYEMRGRLVLYEKMTAVGGGNVPRRERREVAVYVELHSERSVRFFCDLGRTDFRPEYKGGLRCALLDEQERPVPSAPIHFGGGVPQSGWVTLPSDATIRLRSSPFGVGREAGLAIWADSGSLWVIAADDPKEYFLSGSFTVDPATVAKSVADGISTDGAGHTWSGTIVLPAVRIGGRPRASTSLPATTQTSVGGSAAELSFSARGAAPVNSEAATGG